MRTKTTSLSALFLALAAGAVTGCAPGAGSSAVAEDCVPAHEFDTVTEGTLTVVLYDLPPFSRLEESEISGVDGDIVNAIAENECLTVSAQALATAANIPTVQAGRADLSIGAWYRTAARAEVVDLTEPIYTDQMAIISTDGYTSIDQLDQLDGVAVGTVDGYLWVDDVAAILGDGLRVYPTTLDMNQDLAAGRIQVGIDSYGSGVYNADGDVIVEVIEPDDRIAASREAAQISIPIPKGNTALLTALNENIAELRERGELARILETNGLDASAADTGEARLIG